MLLLSAPGAASAAADAEQTGILAFLGLTAADGKTELGDGAGSIEASLLNADAVNHAGAVIAGLVNSRLANRSNVLVLTHGDTVNLTTLRIIRARLTHFTQRFLTFQCRRRPRPTRIPEANLNGLLEMSGHFTPADAIGALAVSTSYAAVEAPVDERLLINSLIVNGGLRLQFDNRPRTRPASWLRPEWDDRTGGGRVRFVVPTELQANPESGLFQQYLALVRRADELRPCGAADADLKAAVDDFASYATALNASEDNAPSLLAVASQLDVAAPGGAAASILRVAVEQSGGTTATRSSIWYTLGFPGAATVGSGLLISFRLIDADSGESTFAGVVRCATRRQNIRSIARIVQGETVQEWSARSAHRPDTGCTYIAGES
jgi:hypothetical protein